jgi:hypothetical protein
MEISFMAIYKQDLLLFLSAWLKIRNVGHLLVDVFFFSNLDKVCEMVYWLHRKIN